MRDHKHVSVLGLVIAFAVIGLCAESLKHCAAQQRAWEAKQRIAKGLHDAAY